MLHRLVYRRLNHGAHGFHRKRCSGRRLLDCLRRLLRGYPDWLLSAGVHRFGQEFPRFLEISGAVFAVITWTTSFVDSSLRLSPPKLGGARPWARAPALNVTETNAV